MKRGERVPDGMSVNTRYIDAPPSAVWATLADGWLYPVWVVGAARMREVEDLWPARGAKLHHSVGIWPALVDDDTEVLESVPEQLLRLRARAWPVGEAEVLIRLRGTGTGTEVEITEEPASGPGRLVPPPMREPILKWRNHETLRRLGYIAERRAADVEGVEP
jgi:uncharacterized protein YndB with AHSA1/START domain